MKIFLDTNVLAGAFGTRGLCADVLNVVLTRHHLLVSRHVLDELRRTLVSKFHVPPAAAAGVLAFLKSQALVSKPGEIHPALRQKLNPIDREIVAAAITAQADVFVTGDKEILTESLRVPLKILSPRQLWEMEGEGRS